MDLGLKKKTQASLNFIFHGGKKGCSDSKVSEYILH